MNSVNWAGWQGALIIAGTAFTALCWGAAAYIGLRGRAGTYISDPPARACQRNTTQAVT